MKAKHMRFLVLLAVVMLLVSMIGVAAYATGTNPAGEPVCYTHGDVNADGEITGEDAVYLLFASFDMFKDEYVLEQNGDIDENDQFDGNDAVYLLFASIDMFKDEYPLKGTVHNYYDPLWTWDTAVATPTAQVSLKCACGQPHTITEGITVTPGTVIEPTCVTTGSKEYTATVTYEGTVFTNTVTVILDAKGVNGHEFNGTPTCENGVKCNNCDYTLPALDHNYELMDTEKVEGCKHTKRYQCSACQQEIDGTAEGDVYYTHSYTAKILEEATCSAKGTKLQSCACGHSYEEDIAKNDSHTWTKGSTENGVTTYNCACGATKTVVEVAKDQAVSKDALKDNEVQLEGGTTVALDEATVEQLDTDKTIKITVEAVKADQVQMDADKKEQIGQNDIYDFSMTYSDGTPISAFDGLVTVALPYTLQDGDDANSIDVWYIADDGSVECVKGVYSNGYVTFQTDHFSYYTVTRLTPAQRCAVYGHVELTSSKAATCTEDGYTKVYCQRCAEEISQTKIPMLGHNYAKDAQQSKAATCNAAGIHVEVCGRCNHKKSEEVKQLSHIWEKTETVAAGCTNKGYDKFTCQLCNKEKIENEKEAIGHAWTAADNAWQWSADKTKATLTLTCANGSHDAKVLTAVITKEGEPSVCLGGNVTYTAKVHFNNVPYENTVVDVQTGLGHNPSANWETDSTQHYRLCTVCGEKLGSADHQWERTVNTPATCGKTGTATDKCAICDMEKSVVLPISGEHNFVKGTCTVCGQEAEACDHTLVDEVIDLGKLGACQGGFTIRSCACGEIVTVTDSDFTCDFETIREGYDKETNTYVYIEKCKVCGLEQTTIEGTVYDEDACTAAYGYESSITVNGNVIASVFNKQHTTEHPAVVGHETVNFADYGMCGGAWQRMTCYCGERTYYDVVEESKCRYSDETNTCLGCGTKLVYTDTTNKVGCNYIYESTYTYSKNGTTVLTLTEQSFDTNHTFEVTGTKKYGDTCSDGVVTNRRCTQCGKTEVRYYGGCYASIVKETIDTTGVGFCTDTLVIYECPCGRTTEYGLEGENYHNFNYGPVVNGVETAVCQKCGYTMTRTYTYGEKDANCELLYSVDLVFTDDAGHRFATTYQYTRTQHDIENVVDLKGDSCEDGVTITQSCKDCDYTETWTNNYHNTLLADSLDLSAYGFCGGTLTVYTCPCGEESNMNGMYNCSWETLDYQYTDQGEIYLERCSICGIIREQLITTGENIDTCRYPITRNYKFYKGEQLLGQISHTYIATEHRYVYQLTLDPGSVTCSDGYTYVGTCMGCGELDEGSGTGCRRFIVARETIDASDLCGALEKLTYGCACGNIAHTETCWMTSECCMFEYKGYDNDAQAQLYVCGACGAYQHYTNTYAQVEGSHCQFQDISTTTWFNQAGDVLLVESTIRNGVSHTYINTFTLLGETCADGYQYHETCLYCGYDNGSYEGFDCETRRVSRELVYDNDALCGAIYMDHYRCACGAEEYYTIAGDHNFRWTPDGYEACIDCDIVWLENYKYAQIPGTCRRTATRTDTFVLNGHTVATVTKTWEETEHIYLYTYNLLGDSCEDGYTISSKCAYCDAAESYDNIYTDHSNRLIGYYAMPEGSCGGYISLYGCACSKNGRIEYNYSCDWSEFTPEGGTESGEHWYRCDNCGLVEQCTRTLVDDTDPCELIYAEGYKLFRGDELLVNWSYTQAQENHTYLYTFTLNSEDAGCQGGWTAVGTCTVCGYQVEEYDNDCYYRTVERKVISTDDMCGQLLLEHYRCACGKQDNVDISWISDETCDFNYVRYDKDLDAELYTCDTCGSYYYYKHTSERVAGTTCENRHQSTSTYYNKAGQLLGEESSEYYDYSHNNNYTFQMHGETCDDGFDIYWTCLNCGESGYHTDDSGCSAYRVSTELVYDSDDICDAIYLNHYSCPCGANQSYSCSAENHNWENSVCTDCGLAWDYEYDYTRTPNTCRGTANRTETFTKNGEVVVEVEKSWEQNEHIYLHTYSLLGDSCEDGYTYSYRCAYCDYSGSSDVVQTEHANRTTEYYELSDNTCGGVIYYSACACGFKTNIDYSFSCETTGQSWSETDKNGVTHSYYTYACDTCDLSYNYESYQTPGEDACHYTENRYYTFKIGDWEKDFTVRYNWESHDYLFVSVELDTDSVNCEDGIHGIQRCADCGNEVEFTSDGHIKAVVDTIDLSQYGSDCGATLALMQCACKKHTGYEITEDSLCDLDEKYTEHWIDGVIDEWQYTSEGQIDFTSDSYIYTCSVTDPACGLKIRMSRYWLNENCTAVQYETWQLGYEPKTGTCLKEITIPTGQRQGYHPYEATSFEEIVDGQRRYGWRSVCPDCGSTYTYTYYSDADGNDIKYVSEAVNTKTNGENKKYTETIDYVYNFGHKFTSLDREEWVHADGTIYWRQNAYTYDYTDSCSGTRVYTDSDGNTDTYDHEAHYTPCNDIPIKEKTCTQYGEYVDRHVCLICNELVSENKYTYEPTAHNWYKDEETGIYRCYDCGLESKNGASGKIVLEDLTDEYTEGNYVIGYWNRGSVAFNTYVSLVLYDVAEDENDELVLTDIDFTYLTVMKDGICGLEFSQEAVAAAAAAALEEAGYTGTYAVRISFVPLNGADALDYAITFETLTAE